MGNIKKYEAFIVENLETKYDNLKSFFDNLNKEPSLLLKIRTSLIEKKIKFFVDDFLVPWDIFSSNESFIYLTSFFILRDSKMWSFQFDADWLYNKENFSMSEFSEKGLSKIYNSILEIGNVQNAFIKINQS